METGPAFSIAQLSKLPQGTRDDAEWRKLADKFRALRLRSLQIAPEAFASTYEVECQRGIDQTFDRLSNPKARHFVAVEIDAESQRETVHGKSIDDLCKLDWIGMIVLLGPVEDGVTARTDPITSLTGGKGSEVGASGLESRRRSTHGAEFVLNGVFAEPAVRGRGVGKALMDTALEQARGVGDESKAGAFVTVLVDSENAEARKLYEKAGFAVVGEERYTQQPRSLLGEKVAAERVALKMRLNLG